MLKKFIFDNILLNDNENFSEELKKKLFNEHLNNNSFFRGMFYRMILEKINLKKNEVLFGMYKKIIIFIEVHLRNNSMYPEYLERDI